MGDVPPPECSMCHIGRVHHLCAIENILTESPDAICYHCAMNNDDIPVYSGWKEKSENPVRMFTHAVLEWILLEVEVFLTL